MRRLLLPGWLGALVLLTGCAGPAQEQEQAQASGSAAVPAGAQPAVVVRPVDGDTVVLRGRGTGPLRGEARVRLLLVDTPEVFSGPECFGPDAQRRTAELLPRGAQVRVEADRQLRDRYGRPLLHVYDERGRNVGEVLLREGYARVLVVRPNERHLAAFRAAERAAQRDGRGVWSACPT